MGINSVDWERGFFVFSPIGICTPQVPTPTQKN